MQFEWDDDKARSNLAKHGVSFELAMRVWEDPLYREIEDRIVDGQMRWHAIGWVTPAVLLVVFTEPDPSDDTRIRIISARQATPKERRDYEQKTLFH